MTQKIRPLSKEEKEAAIDRLLATKRKGHLLEIDLLFKGRDEEVEEVKAKNSALADKIDALLAAIMKEWIDDTDAGVNKELKKINRKLQDSIREIKRDIQIAKNVVKILGYLDNAIKVAVKLLK